MGIIEIKIWDKVVILEMEITTDLVTIHLMMTVLVTTQTMKISMLMGINQTSLMLIMFKIKEMVLKPRFKNLTKLRTFLVQFQLSFNDCPLTFTNG